MVREAFWRRALASADDVIGTRLEVGGVERTIVGATSARIVHAIVGRAAWQVALGGGIGGVAAVFSLDARAILVSRLGDGGAWTLPVVLVLLVAAGLAATWLPLRRALRVQPSDALRAE